MAADRRPRGVADPAAWRGRRVLVTGHTGFIGGWLCARLHALGAAVAGLALAPVTIPSFHELAGLAGRVNGVTGDIRSPDDVAAAFAMSRPEIVFHLAAQALVGEGYRDPLGTFAVNLAGTVNVLEQARLRPPAALVVMTSDKVYAPGQGGSHHREGDALGPGDPYGASKACCELAVEAYARSFLGASGVGVASVRAGNVIGGGDWAADRLVADAVRAFSAGEPLLLRRPDAVRPWQHVLDAVNGLELVAEAAERRREPLGAWNIGPPPGPPINAGALAHLCARVWGEGARINLDPQPAYPEAPYLAIDSLRARRELGLRPPWSVDRAVRETIDWYRQVLAGADAWALTQAQIAAYDADLTGAAAVAVSS